MRDPVCVEWSKYLNTWVVDLTVPKSGEIELNFQQNRMFHCHLTKLGLNGISLKYNYPLNYKYILILVSKDVC